EPPPEQTDRLGRRGRPCRLPQVVRAGTAVEPRPHGAGVPERYRPVRQPRGRARGHVRREADEHGVRPALRRHRPVGAAPLPVPAEPGGGGGQPGRVRGVRRVRPLQGGGGPPCQRRDRGVLPQVPAPVGDQHGRM
ncbi:MAG: hypothetical protein AVDCRST_MAG51-248, partial [uncultured Ramlibacter sp.]